MNKSGYSLGCDCALRVTFPFHELTVLLRIGQTAPPSVIIIIIVSLRTVEHAVVCVVAAISLGGA